MAVVGYYYERPSRTYQFLELVRVRATFDAEEEAIAEGDVIFVLDEFRFKPGTLPEGASRVDIPVTVHSIVIKLVKPP